MSAKVIVTEKITDLKIRAIITQTAGTNITTIETVEMLKFTQTNTTDLEVGNAKEKPTYKAKIKSDSQTFNQLVKELRQSLCREHTKTNNTTTADHFNVNQVTFSQ